MCFWTGLRNTTLKCTCLHVWACTVNVIMYLKSCATRGQSQSQILRITTTFKNTTSFLCLLPSFQPLECVSLFSGVSPPACAAPLPRFLSWGENTVCTSGGDPGCTGVSCGKGYEVKDAVQSLYEYIYVCMCALRVSCDPDSQMLLITNSWQSVQSTNPESFYCDIRWNEGGGQNILYVFYLMNCIRDQHQTGAVLDPHIL